MRFDCHMIRVLVLFAVSMFGAWPAAGQSSAGTSDVDVAIATFRKVDPEMLKDPEQSKRTKAEMGAAWDKMDAAGAVMHQAGTRGVDRIREELKTLDDAKEKDDFFRLWAGSFLFAANGAAVAKTIAALWDTTPLDLHFNSVFFPACQAGTTQDPRVLPMLTACLRDREGVAFVATHSLTLGWPQTQMFIWGMYGPKGLPVLHETLKATRDPGTRQSAMMVLAVSQYLPALETVRALAADMNAAVRAVALEALGCYGHPQDFGRLTAALKERDEMVLEYAVAGAMTYGDLRAVGPLLPLLKHPKQDIRGVAFMAVLSLPTPAGWRAAIQAAKDARGTEEQRAFEERLQYALGKCPVTADEFLKKSAADQQALVQGVLQAQRDKYVIKAGDKTLTHEDLLKAAADWKTRGRIKGGTYAWVESRHVLAAATDKDIEMLLDVRAQVMKRLSDECMPEVSILDDLIQRLGRSRYRKDTGLTEKAEGLVKDSTVP